MVEKIDHIGIAVKSIKETSELLSNIPVSYTQGGVKNG